MLTLTESYQLRNFQQPSLLNFITTEPVQQSSGELIFGKTGLVLKYDPAKFEVKAETKELEDPRLKKSWGEKIYRLQLIFKSKTLKDQVVLKFYKK